MEQGQTADTFGVIVKENGETVIPSTRRADGTLRKEIRVRAGYIPPDEQVKYVSKGKAIAERSKGFIPGLSREPETKAPATKSQKKNAKRKEKNALGSTHPSTNTTGGTENELAAKVAVVSISKGAGMVPDWVLGVGGTSRSIDTTPAKEEDPEVCKAKKVKAIQKKIRQIEDLKAQVEKGVTLSEEQKEKLAREEELKKQLRDLQGL